MDLLYDTMMMADRRSRRRARYRAGHAGRPRGRVIFCEEALSRRKRPPTPTRARVEKVLLKVLPKGVANVSNVAEILAMSTSSLERQLNEEGTSYTAVLGELRRELAMQYLEDKTLGVGQIAWLLGYSEVSSFNHAFRRWTSRSPRAVRGSLKNR